MKIWKRLYVVVLCIILAAPSVLLPFSKEISAEKRVLSAFPSLIDENGWNVEFTAQLDTWLCEHFPFRSQIISANNYWKSAMFATSDEQQVIVGDDGWLYFSETLPDYQGTNDLSDTALQQLQTIVFLIEETVRAAGADFVFTVAPNKNTIYPAYMPKRYPKAENTSNLERLTDLLKDAGYFADLSAALRDTDEQTYHKRDTHWNAYGASQGYRALMSAANKQTNLFDDSTFTWKNTWRGDLDDMIFPALDIKDAQAVYDTAWTYAFTSNYRNDEDLLITTENENGNGSLLMYRDSFGNALLPFMAQTYQKAVFSRVTPYDFTDITQYDTVILEIVERNLANLLRAAPIVSAPVRQQTKGEPVTPTVLKTREKDDLLHLYGTLPKTAKRVYLQVSKDADAHIFEAFPIAETALLGLENIQENGFSAYVPAEFKDYTVAVFIEEE